MAGNDPGTFINTDDAQPNISMATAPVSSQPLNPVAANTPLRYSPPAIAKNDNLTELARGLSQFDAGLSDFMEARDKQQADRDRASAQADFVKNHQQDYASAVAAGSIPASASPVYISAYKESQGQLYGQVLEQKFQSAYDSWSGKGQIDDPDAYSKFAQDFFSRNINTSDPDVLRGLMPVVHEIAEHGLRQDVQNQHDTVTQGFANTLSATVNNKIAQAVGYANTTGNPLEPSWVSQQVGSAYDQALAVGVKAEDAQKQAIVQITTAALLNKAGHGDEILKALDSPFPGTGLVLSQTEYGAEQKARVQNELDNYHREQALRESEAQKAADKKSLGVVEERVLGNLVKDPSAPVPDADLKEGSKYDPTFRARVIDWQDKVFKNGGESDPAGLMQLHRDIMSGAGMDSVTHAVEMGVIKNPRDLKAATEEVEEHQKADPVMHSLVQSEPYKGVMGTIKAQTAATGAADPFGTTGLTATGLGLQYELNKRMQEWAAANPGASYNDTQEQFAKVSADVLKMIQVPKNQLFGGQATLPADNPYAGLTQQGGTAPSPTTPTVSPQPSASSAAPPSATSTKPQSLTSPGQPSTSPSAAPAPSSTTTPLRPATGSASGLPPDPQLVKAWAAGLSPADQESLARVALKRGMDPQQLLNQAYLRANPSRPATGASTTGTTSTTAPGQPAGPSSAQPFGDLNAARGAALAAQPQYQKGAAEQFGDAVAKWQATDPNAPAIIHQFTGMLQGIHASLPYQGSTTLAAIKDNPQAAHLLDFVAGPESRGNYNAYFGHADNDNVKLTGMTLNELLQFQHNLVAVDGQPSSASGRYQFMPNTLKTLMAQMHLTGNERFTPEMQDNLALQLLKNRGLEQWQAGKLDDATFMNNLAYEWASLPNPHTGRSQYGGDGLNKSLVTPSQVQNALDGARAAGAEPSPTSSPAPTAPGAAPTPSPQPASSGEGVIGRFVNGIWGEHPEPAAAAPAQPQTDLGVPPPPPPAPQANTNAKDFVVGDSLGDGVRSAMKAEGDTKVSRPPAEVLARIKALPEGALAGKRTVVISTGLSNNPTADAKVVEDQINTAISKGANWNSIRVLGVGDRADFKANQLNDKIKAACIKLLPGGEKQFLPVGALPPGEHVHPDTVGYRDIANRATAAT